VVLHNTVGWAWRYSVGNAERLMYLINVKRLQLPPDVSVRRYWWEYVASKWSEYDPHLYERMFKGARALLVIYDLATGGGRAALLDIDIPSHLFTLFIRVRGLGVLPDEDLEAAFGRLYVPAKAYVAFAGGDIGLAAYAPDPEDCTCLRRFVLKRGGGGWEVLPYGGGSPRSLAEHLGRPELEEGAEELCLELAAEHIRWLSTSRVYGQPDRDPRDVAAEEFPCQKWHMAVDLYFEELD